MEDPHAEVEIKPQLKPRGNVAKEEDPKPSHQLYVFPRMSVSFYIFHRRWVCLVDCVDLICKLYSLWEGFGSSSLATLPLSFNCGFISTSACGSSIHWGLLLRLPWRTWICPSKGQVWRWCSCLVCRGSGSTRYSGEWSARAAGNIVFYKGMAMSIGLYTSVF